ncbi:TPA: phytanoyl-CoA dioxygenase [Candidatus Poribacteria bacterium]|nr:phytanoyl-CoA dioxygenase [Candidatus Poribacteria bacterium]
MVGEKKLLNDQEMRDFIQNGYVTLKTDLPASFHNNVYQKVEEMFEDHGNLGNNILPLVPDMQKVFDHPVVHGAMTSILGPNYVMHPHRYCHLNQPGSQGQGFHKDSYEGDEQVRHHRCRWTMAFYYPQDTTEDMGPTAVLPGTQYYDTHETAHSQPELSLCGKAGTLTIVHYDLWHRAMPNHSQKKRYMVKFLFIRLEDPQEPSWDNDQARWQSSHNGNSDNRHQFMWSKFWNWYRGKQNGAIEDIESTRENTSKLIKTLQDKNQDEALRLEAAYVLGTIGPSVVPTLIEMLRDDSEDVSHHATFALGASGGSAVPALIIALDDTDESVRANAAFALGDIGRSAQEATPKLTQLLNDESEWVRRHASEALGTIGHPSEETVSALTLLLQDEHYWIRDNAARALAKMGISAESAIPALIPVLNDENRYVRFHAALALKQIGTSAATNILFDHLLTSRWCSLTNRNSAY